MFCNRVILALVVLFCLTLGQVAYAAPVSHVQHTDPAASEGCVCWFLIEASADWSRWARWIKNVSGVAKRTRSIRRRLHSRHP
ncbi:hypothetical protein H2248_011949 [Termitomyces sp. 'cryptogamus']|nr:hypothetical protein H2248_011949 [Termitomyces sp. 'cryptogamus']